MPAWSGMERTNAKKIMCKENTLFVVNSNRIGSLIIGGIDNHYSYETLYPKRKYPFAYQPHIDDSYPIVLEVKEEESRYYFTTLDGTTRIQKPPCGGYFVLPARISRADIFLVLSFRGFLFVLLRRLF